jgi:hypothetical protein
MPKTYSPADDEVFALAKALRKEHHELLDKAKVTIELMFVQSDSDPVLSHHGAPAFAVVRIIGAKDRAAGRADAEIVIDGDAWSAMTPETRKALLDHELHHLIVSVKDGEIQWDAQERPKLKMRKHDAQFGWFHEIAKRHGKASIEVMQAHRLATEYGQLYFKGLLDTTQPTGRLPERSVEPANGAPVTA